MCGRLVVQLPCVWRLLAEGVWVGHKAAVLRVLGPLRRCIAGWVTAGECAWCAVRCVAPVLDVANLLPVNPLLVDRNKADRQMQLKPQVVSKTTNCFI